MSRCFPYPPPGYCRNGATYEALIESIKLQKETDKAKAERRKEKRAKKEQKEKRKNEKEKRKNEEKVKSQKNQSHDLTKAGFTEAQIKGTNEVLERSDLTEEHGLPIKPSYSSDSTQNSNKRRRDDDGDDVLLPDDTTCHGKPIKIRLLKKHKGSESSNSGEDKLLKTAPLVQPFSLDRTQLVSGNRSHGIPATSGRDNSVPQGTPLTQTKLKTSFERPKASNPNGLNGLYLGREQSASGSSVKPILPSGSRKSDLELLKSRQQIESFVRPVLPQSHLEHAIPSTSVSSNIGALPGLNSYRQQQQGPSNLNPGVPGPVLNKPNPSTGKWPVNQITVGGNIGPTKPEKKKEDSKKAGHTRHEKKMLKKQAKYEKLIGSWVPPVFQALLPDVEDDTDWLCRKTKTAKQSPVSRDEVESCREVAETSLWQPCARFLAEADVYALPYTVPF